MFLSLTWEGFYSKLVRLKVSDSITLKIWKAAFLFQTGAIKRALSQPKPIIYTLSFYSKLVRLKVKKLSSEDRLWLSFLFQTGAIKSDTEMQELSEKWARFLFQTGAIKRRSCLRNCRCMLRKSFYSKLVRLKAINNGGTWTAQGASFYSKLVRLKASRVKRNY